MIDVQADLKQKWDRVSQRLRAELGDDLFSSWFARMEPEDLAGGRLAVSVPTRFLKSWIEAHYLPRLHKTSEIELGHLDQVQVRVRTRGVPLRIPEETERRSDNGHHAPAAPPMPIPSNGFDRASPTDSSQTFETFIVGSSNQLAHAAAMRVADAAAGSAVSFNPLFVHAAA
ncbi:MAG TPA: DnaA N-terminal domain-containing protein, partial [Aestuariivirga sp.]|nr:DnaA N-terminal domain-containing protein [Aestuariivirga sp.]